jgi:SulP family sulfate permease
MFYSRNIDLISSLVAGSISGLIFIVSAMGFASLIFVGPLASYLSMGIGIILLGSAVFAFYSACTSSHPVLLDCPQEIPIAMLALIVSTIVQENRIPPDELFGFIFISFGLSSILVGIFFGLLGSFRMGKLVRFIPYPVVGGFLAGTGWLLFLFSLSMMTGLEVNLENTSLFFEQETLVHWVPGTIFGLIMLISSRKISHYLFFPIMLLMGAIVFGFVVFFSNASIEQWSQEGFLLGPFPEGNLFAGSTLPYLPQFQWSIYLEFAPELMMIVVLSSISMLFNFSGLELTIKKDFDLDRELRHSGYSNIIAGFFGSPPGYLTLSESTLSHRIGVNNKWASVVVGIFCVLAIFIGADVFALFPKFILGGLMLQLGCLFLVEWLIDSWSDMPLADYLIIISILISIALLGFLEGVILGLILSVGVFVLNYSKVKIIKYAFTGQTLQSNVERSERLTKIINTAGEEVFILCLQGYLFFGTAHRIVERIEERATQKNSCDLNYLIFDLQQITGMDSSALRCFDKIQQQAENYDFVVIFVNINIPTATLICSRLQENNPSLFRILSDLDHAMEWCEEDILWKQECDETLIIQGSVDSFEYKFKSLLPYFEKKTIPEDTTLIQQGKTSNGLFFIEFGQITVKIDTEGMKKRIKSMGKYTFVGEVSLYLHEPATATVTTNRACIVYYLSRKQFESLLFQDPEAASLLHTHIIKVLSRRLNSSNISLQAVLHKT